MDWLKASKQNWCQPCRQIYTQPSRSSEQVKANLVDSGPGLAVAKLDMMRCLKVQIMDFKIQGSLKQNRLLPEAGAFVWFCVGVIKISIKLLFQNPLMAPGSRCCACPWLILPKLSHFFLLTKCLQRKVAVKPCTVKNDCLPQFSINQGQNIMQRCLNSSRHHCQNSNYNPHVMPSTSLCFQSGFIRLLDILHTHIMVGLMDPVFPLLGTSNVS